MKYKDGDPDNLGGPGDLLPADILKMLNELLEQLQRAGHTNQGSKIEVVYVASGGQHVETQIIASPCPPPTGGGNTNGREKGSDRPALPDVLSTEKAMALWEKVQAAGYVDEHYQPTVSRTQAALLADAMAERLGIKEKWKVFGELWKRKNMYYDYYKALGQRQSLVFQDELKQKL
jgi:hypothetical protein